jgi:hypothetical protein
MSGSMAIIRTACADADEQYGEGMSVNAAASFRMSIRWCNNAGEIHCAVPCYAALFLQAGAQRLSQTTAMSHASR